MAELTIQTITSEAEYDATLTRITELWGALPFTAAYDELTVLIAMAIEWETAHYNLDT